MIFKVIKKPSLLCSIPYDMTGHIKKTKETKKKVSMHKKLLDFFLWAKCAPLTAEPVDISQVWRVKGIII